MKKRKKGTLSLTKVVSILILLFGFLWLLSFFAPKGFLNELAEWSKGLNRLLPGNVPEDVKPDLAAPKGVSEDFDSFVNALRNADNQQHCLLYHSGFDSIDSGYSILITVADGDMFVALRNSKGQTIDSETIIGKKPCVVGGERNGVPVAQVFYDKYIEKRYNVLGSDYQTFNGAYIGGGDELILSEGSSSEFELSLDDNSLEYNGQKVNMLYKVDSQHVCFIASYDGDWVCNAGKKGVDDNCFSKLKVSTHISVCGNNS